MKKAQTFLILTLILLAINFVVPLKTEATVGGPTTIGNFKYSAAEKSIYFISNSASGRGCPAILRKKSLISGESTTVYSCEEGEKFLRENPNIWIGSEFAKITQNFENLKHINLKENNIAFDIDFVKENNLDNSNFLRNRDFLVSVYQDDKKIDSFSVTGCELEQPFLFAGYAVPNITDKIVLLLSAKSDCFEGGYIGERLFIVDGVKNLNQDFFTNSYKNDKLPILPDIGTLLVFESDKKNADKTDDLQQISGIEDNDDENQNTNYTLDFNFLELLVLILVFIVSFVLGLIFGKVTKGEKTNITNSDSSSNIVR